MSNIIKIEYKKVLIKLKTMLIEDKINLLKLLISFMAVVIILLEFSTEIRTLNINITIYLLRRLEIYKFLLMALFGMAAVLSMSLYDIFVIKKFKIDLAMKKVVKISWIANTFNNILGFAGIVGVGIRTILYKKEKVEISNVIKLSELIALSTVTGLSILSWLGIINIFRITTILESHKILWIGPVFFACYLPLYLMLYKIKWLKERFISDTLKEGEPKEIRIELIPISIFEWIIAGSFLWFICRYFTSNISYIEALGVLIISAIVGIMSLIPGGVGAFDLVFYLGLQSLGSEPHEAFAILILYRTCYYLLPWIIGIILSINEMEEVIVEKIPKKNFPMSLIYKSVSKWQKIWLNNYDQIRDFGVWALSILVFLSGVILVLSSALPGIAYRLDIVAEITSFSFMKFSHRMSIAIGLILLVLSKGIKEHIRRAYSLTLTLLLVGALFTFMKGLNYEEAIFLFVVAFLLRFTRKRYYRESAPIKISTAILFFIITFLSVIFYVYLAHEINLGFQRVAKHPYIIRKILINQHEIIYNAIYAFVLAWSFLIVWGIIRPKRPFEKLTADEDLERLSEFLKNNEGTSLTHLLFLKDKSLYWAQDGKVVIAYANIRDKLIVLGDPIGDEAYLKEAIQEFQEFADKYALNIAFYQVTEKYFSIYHENGYYFFKLGEEAIVDLETFNLAGGKKKDLRLVKNRFEKQNFNFEVLHPSFSEELLDELQEISDVWLEEKKEKGFSLGWFDREYIQYSPIAILKNEENKIIAFATLMPKYDNKTISIDLMRFAKEVPNGTMDTLFLQTILWCQKEGYRYFNLGMAPLSNVGLAPYAHRQEKLAKLVYNLGNYWYSFSGLRKYKEKFDPVWKSKFLAYPKFISLPTLVLDIAILVSQSKKRTTKKLEKK